MPSIADLGKLVKTKYPGQYDDLPDDQLGRRVKLKYPEYSDFTDAGSDTERAARVSIGQSLKKQYPGSYDTLNDEELGGTMIKLGIVPGLAPATAPAQPGAMQPSQSQGFNLGNAVDIAQNALPSLLGIAGSIVGAPAGPPGMMAGAALGGTGGEAWRQNIARARGQTAPQGGDEALLRLLGAGGEQAAYELLGQTAGRAGMAVAKPLMAKALSPAKALVANFPAVVSDALKSAVPVGKIFGKLGSGKATAIRESATGAVKDYLQNAAGQGHMFDREQLAQPAIEAVSKKLGRALNRGEELKIIRMVSARAGKLLTQGSMGIRRAAIQADPIVMNQVRQLAREGAKAELKGRALGLPPSAIPDLDSHIEQGARQALNTLKGGRGYQPLQRTAAKAIGVERAVKGAELRPSPAAIRVGVGPLHVGVGVPPELASRIALMMSNPAMAPAITNLLRTAGLGAHELYGQQP